MTIRIRISVATLLAVALLPSTASGSNIISLELRWFQTGAPQQEVADWFANLPGNFIENNERTDHYLLVDGRQDLGLKLREGRLELKWLAKSEPFRAGRYQGVSEQWERATWNFSKEQGSSVVSAFTEEGLEGHRRSVHKNRQQRKYEVDPQGLLKPVPMKATLDLACIVELAEVSIDGEPAWTLGFDGIGPDQEVASILSRCVEELLEEYAGPALTENRSFGYPKWLGQD